MAVAALKRKHYDVGSTIPFIVLHASVLLVLTVPFSPQHGLVAGGVLLPSDVWRHGLATIATSAIVVQAQPLLAVLHGVPGPDVRPERARCGGRRITATIICIPTAKRICTPPGARGFWWSHLGWILSDEYDTYEPKRIADSQPVSRSCACSIDFHLLPPSCTAA
jgi:hypothetical protein